MTCGHNLASYSEGVDEVTRRFTRFDDFSFPLPFSLSFSLASSIRFAVPLLLAQISDQTYGAQNDYAHNEYTYLLLNSSGTSTEGFPSSLNLARSAGFSSCFVRDGRDTYGRVALHS